MSPSGRQSGTAMAILFCFCAIPSCVSILSRSQDFIAGDQTSRASGVGVANLGVSFCRENFVSFSFIEMLHLVHFYWTKFTRALYTGVGLNIDGVLVFSNPDGDIHPRSPTGCTPLLLFGYSRDSALAMDHSVFYNDWLIGRESSILRIWSTWYRFHRFITSIINVSFMDVFAGYKARWTGTQDVSSSVRNMLAGIGQRGGRSPVTGVRGITCMEGVH